MKNNRVKIGHTYRVALDPEHTSTVIATATERIVGEGIKFTVGSLRTLCTLVLPGNRILEEVK